MGRVKAKFNNHFTQLLGKLREQNRFRPHEQWVTSVSISPDKGEIIATAGNDNAIKLWQRNGKLHQTLSGHQNAVVSVKFSRDGQTLASASLDKNCSTLAATARWNFHLASRD